MQLELQEKLVSQRCQSRCNKNVVKFGWSMDEQTQGIYMLQESVLFCLRNASRFPLRPPIVGLRNGKRSSCFHNLMQKRVSLHKNFRVLLNSLKCLHQAISMQLVVYFSLFFPCISLKNWDEKCNVTSYLCFKTLSHPIRGHVI